MSFKIVFMGTPEFSLPTLEALIENKFNVVSVYTQPPTKSKRGQKINVSPIEEFSKKNKINFKNPINLNSDEELKIFKELSPDIVVVVAYGQIISKNFLNIAKFGFINIHASLLPKWRGAAPIQRAIMNGDKKIGVSIMKIEEKLDSGPVLASKEIELGQNATHGEIEKTLSVMGANLLVENLKRLERGNSKFIGQVHSEATYAKKIDKGETKINWSLDATKVLAHIHGLSPIPGAWFEYENERFKVLRAKISTVNGKPSYVLDDNLTVACKSNSIQILELQRQGKNKQTAKEFLLGKKINSGSILN
ncbi:MAG TPA: methionyl-tRNA formyltransferase [Pelagibacteraceae bacterium]|jgi:methionyl-tRNA formyltransferase|nr:methionyl-tRNA formyltransferase [Pelagibacteraceae bacterium]HIO51013.1 methionyl-tRNA formyltransferase [Pelagibacteraceae bacterium]